MNPATDVPVSQSLAEIMAKPALSWDEFWTLLIGLPLSTGEELAREPDAPRFFLLGRRRYILRTDATAWLEQRARTTPYVPRRNNHRKDRGGV